MLHTHYEGRALIIQCDDYWPRRVENPYIIKAFERYGFDCAVCKKPYEGYRRNIVHHIDGNPTNQVLDNLIVLCPYCHIKIHRRSKGEFVPVNPPNHEVELALFELAAKVRFRFIRLNGQGYLLRRIENKAGLTREAYEGTLSSKPSQASA